MTYPTFTNGTVLPASDLNAIGLWLVKSQTVGTGVSSVTVTGAFSADYDKYLVTVDGVQGSTLGDLRLQLGSTTTGYYGFIMYGVPSATTLFGINQNNAANFGYVGNVNGTGLTTSCITIGDPYRAGNTYISTPYIGVAPTSAFGNYQGMQNSSTQFTAFTLIPGGGTLTGGTIRVYGYRN
jgi:hypothetical protein